MPITGLFRAKRYSTSITFASGSSANLANLFEDPGYPAHPMLKPFSCPNPGPCGGHIVLAFAPGLGNCKTGLFLTVVPARVEICVAQNINVL